MAVPPLTAPINAPRRDMLTDLWRLFTSSRWVALLLALLAVTIVVFALWPYVLPANPVPAAYSTPGQKALLDQPGQPEAAWLDVYRLYWLRALLALLAFTLLLRLIDRLEAALGFRRRLDTALDLYLGALTCTQETSSPVLAPEDVRETLRGRPAARLARVWEAAEEDGPIIYADRLRVTVWADVAFHLGGLLLVAGLVVATQWSWREDGVALAVGESYRLRNLPGYTLSMESTGAEGASPDQLRQYDSRLTLTPGGGPAQPIHLGAGWPFLRPDLALSQAGAGPALRVNVTNRNGDPLLLQSFVMGRQPETFAVLKFHGVQDDGYLSVPALGLTLRVDRYQSLPEEGYNVPVFLMRAYRGTQSTPLFSRWVTQDGSYEWQDLAFKVHLEDYAVLNIGALYHWWFIAAGLLLVVAGGVLRRWPSPWLARFERVPWAGEDGSITQITVWGAQAAAVAALFRPGEAPGGEAPG